MMHYIKIRYFSWECRPFIVCTVCKFVNDDDWIAEFRKYEDAKRFAQLKATELGMEIIDEYEPILKIKKKKKK